MSESNYHFVLFLVIILQMQIVLLLYSLSKHNHKEELKNEV